MVIIMKDIATWLIFLNLYPLSLCCRILSRLLMLSPPMPLKTWVNVIFFSWINQDLQESRWYYFQSESSGRKRPLSHQAWIVFNFSNGQLQTYAVFYEKEKMTQRAESRAQKVEAITTRNFPQTLKLNPEKHNICPAGFQNCYVLFTFISPISGQEYL